MPTLDGPRDIVTSFTHRPRAGGERQVLEAMRAGGPAQLVVSTGDLVQDGRRGRHWADYAESHRDLRSRVPYFVAPGNHEHIETEFGSGSWNAAVGAPPRPERYWQSVDLPDSLARFVFVDATLLTNVSGIYPDSVAEALSPGAARVGGPGVEPRVPIPVHRSSSPAGVGRAPHDRLGLRGLGRAARNDCCSCAATAASPRSSPGTSTSYQARLPP